MAICLAGDPDDLTQAYVGWLAERRGVAVHTLAEHRFGIDWWYAMDPNGGIEIRLGGANIRNDVTGVFVRLNPDPPVLDELGLPPELRPIYVQERRAGIQLLLNALPVVINRPGGGRSNGSKPLQMAYLSAAGFAVPEWTVTNVGDAADSFFARCPDGAIVKSCSGLRSHVRRLDDGMRAHITAGTAPVLIQRYVAGHDVRVHVVDDRVFATRVESDLVDYRFDGDQVSFRQSDIADSLLRRCRVFAKRQGVVLAGFDFRVDPEGRWWCLEMNPVPTFLPYEAGTGHPIGDAVVDLLAPDSRTRPAASPLHQQFRPALEAHDADPGAVL